MKYMGSKNRIAKHILPIMLEYMERNSLEIWIEPFVGGGNMIDKVPSKYKRIGLDINSYVIEALKFIRDDVKSIPHIITEDMYNAYKSFKRVDGITGFVAFFNVFWWKIFWRIQKRCK
ncbi:MAG: DNA adenine methylase [Novosphingobium sp.]|nr:DNA adenine methylase [Novosphingobium sp.]